MTVTRHKPLCVNPCTLRLLLQCLILELDLNLLPVFIPVSWGRRTLLLFLGQELLEAESLQGRQRKKPSGACGTRCQRKGQFLSISVLGLMVCLCSLSAV